MDGTEQRVTSPFRVGGWLAEPTLNRISRGKISHSLEPKVMQVLVYLAQRQGQVVSRQELADQIWGDVILVDGVLTRVIHLLRDLFDDDHRKPRYIETIRKGGYRLIQEVVWEDPRDEPHGTAEKVESAAATSRSSWLRGLNVAVILVALGVIAVLVTRDSRRPAGPTGSTLLSKRLTSYPGRERHPSFSPDGNLVAFTWECGDCGGFDIFVRQVDEDNPLRLTDHPADEIFPTWSPDGGTIAFLRRGAEGGLFTVPALGGPAQRHYAFQAEPTGLDWSPDGRLLVFAPETSQDSTRVLLSFDLETREITQLTTPPPHYRGDRYPAFSPDGGTIAFVRSDPAGFHDIYNLNLADRTLKRITHDQGRVVSIDWFPDGRRLIFCAKPGKDYQLWALDLDGGRPRWLPTQHEAAMRPALSPRGDKLVYEALLYGSDVWQLALDADARPQGIAAPLISSTAVDRAARFSPDGTRLAFISSRSGFMEIWVSDADGKGATGRNMDEILRVVKALQITDEHTVATPANWEPGKKVIMPPPKSVEAAEERVADEGVECTDWYFCKKDL